MVGQYVLAPQRVILNGRYHSQNNAVTGCYMKIQTDHNTWTYEVRKNVCIYTSYYTKTICL